MSVERRPRAEGRSGFTTGACSAAAARAATMALIQEVPPITINTLLPNGQRLDFPLAACQRLTEEALAVVIKDGGSGPDVTHGARITATVRRLPGQAGVVILEGGEGVGRVTRPGLAAIVGTAAINPIPRENIEANVREAGAALLQRDGLQVILSVPGGEAMARRTLNPRLGIVGGISILGVSGLAHPYSTAAFKATVIQGIRAAAAQQSPAVVLTTGGRTERFAMNALPQVPQIGFVQMGDYPGVALQALAEETIPQVILAGFPGKLVKIAEGRANTHASKGRFSPLFLMDLAGRAGVPNPESLAEANTVLHALEILTTGGYAESFQKVLAEAVLQAVRVRLPDSIQVGILVFDFAGNLVVSTGKIS